MKRNLSPGNVILLLILVSLIIWGLVKRQSVSTHIANANAVVTGIAKGAKGSQYIHYEFYADGEKVNSSMPLPDCKECEAGDTILVKYDYTDPSNSEFIKLLVKKAP